MVITSLCGGLGNQMFQYAVGRHLSLQHGTDLKLDLAWFSQPHATNTTSRDYELHIFDIAENIATAEDIERTLFRSRHPLLRRIEARARAIVAPSCQRRFSHFQSGFDPAVLRAGKDAYLEGYWPSEKYFISSAETIRRDFTFKSPLEGQNAALAARMQACDSVSLHVRRQDYVANPSVRAVHASCSPDYYAQAVAHITERVTAPRLFVFSDDPAWCRTGLSFPCPTEVVDLNHGSRSYEDMRLMSLCRHHIIANSTFSWWGAWLNADAHKIVVAPGQWFNDPAEPCDDLVPPGWVQIRE